MQFFSICIFYQWNFTEKLEVRVFSESANVLKNFPESNAIQNRFVADENSRKVILLFFAGQKKKCVFNFFQKCPSERVQRKLE